MKRPLGWSLALLSLYALPAHAVSSLLVHAYEFDRSNLDVHDVGMPWTDTEPALINGGPQPNTAEYDLDFPVTADYALHARYSAADSRPVDIFLDGALVVRGFTSTTGSWLTSTARWEKQADVKITAGKHTIRLVCPGPCIPHIVALRFDSSVPFPAGARRKPKPMPEGHASWSGRPEPGKYDYEAYVRPDGFVDAPADYDPMLPFNPVPAPEPQAERVLEYLLMGEGRYHVQADLKAPDDDADWTAQLSVKVSDTRTDTAVLPLKPERIKAMLEHARFLAARFGGGAGAGEADGLLSDLARLSSLPDPNPAKGQGLYDLYVRAYRLKNRVALSNPLLGFAKLLFVKRQTYDTSHIYTTYFDGSHRYGGGVATLSPLRPDGRCRMLKTGLPGPAIYRDPDLSWDATKLIFSFKPDMATPCRLYEMSVDGGAARQLTSSDYDDVYPCYLPSGQIMFVSTRCRRVVLCHNAFTVSVLHVMDPDGSNVRCVSSNTVNEFTPSVLADGRVAYTRWEYVDKHLGNNQSMWAVNPDGSHPRHIAGEHWGPITLWEPRQVPGSDKIVTTLAPHMPIAVGPIALVDPADVCSSPARFENLTPEIPPPHHFGWARAQNGFYCNPYPLSEDFFLVSYAYGPDAEAPAGYGLYLLDRWNNRDLIYRDPDLSAFEARPVQPRPKPPVVFVPPPESTAPATVCLLDIYRGLSGIARGTIKYLRIVEEVPKPVAADCSGPWLQYPVVSYAGHLVVKRLLGTVPVEPDGSAYFHVPADTGVYFAALDESMMEVQRMRALTEVRAGETLSCVGCHEARTTAPPLGRPAAFRRPPSPLTEPPGGPRASDFARDVQPLLSRHCLQCHSGGKPAAGLNLSPAKTNLFNVAYENLMTRALVKYAVANDSSTLPLRPAMYYGSHASKLITTLLTTHRDRVQLTRDEFTDLVTWVDLNAPYYGTYLYSRPGTLGGRELVTPGVRSALKAVYDRRCAACHQADTARVERINFEEVEQSPALLAPLARPAGGTGACGRVFESRDDPDTRALLQALHLLADEMKTNPREDMLADRPPITEKTCRYVYRP